MRRSRFGLFGMAALGAFLMLAAGPAVRARGKKIVWKPVTAALLKLNNHPVKTWNVLQADKNHKLVLVQVSADWYVLDLKRKRAYKVEGRDYVAHGENLVGPEPDEHTPRVKTDGWDAHDIGPAQQITVRFAANGNVLAVELPHPLDIY